MKSSPNGPSNALATPLNRKAFCEALLRKTSGAVAEPYLVRVATMFPSPFPASSAVCADGSDATEDTSAGGVD
jgi:hypothetical protein